MDFQEFAVYMQQKMQTFMGEEAEVRLHQVTKNNGVALQGLSVMEPGSNLSPTIYLEDFYELYEKGKSLEQVFIRILELYEKRACAENFSSDWFCDFEKVKSRIVCKLIHYEKNAELLKHVPYLPFLDLALVCYCLLPGGEEEAATILIHDACLELWGITGAELFCHARQNTRALLPPSLRSMRAVLAGFGNGEEAVQSSFPLYVLTNVRNLYGAAAVIYEGVLEQCRERLGEDFYVLPSSIHEVLLVPLSAVEDGERLKQMVQEVNAELLSELEILSDGLYQYLGEEKKLRAV